MLRFMLNLACRQLAHALCVGLFLFPALHTAGAQGKAEYGGLVLELNKAENTGQNCRFSFVLSNRTEEPVDNASYELVLFSIDGVIDQMSVFDFGSLPNGKTVVRQFELPGSCEKAGRILVNGPSGCRPETPSPHCTVPLVLSSRTSQDLLQ